MKKNLTLGLVSGLLVGVTTLFASAPAQAQYVNSADPHSWYFWANPHAASPYVYGYPNANGYGNVYGNGYGNSYGNVYGNSYGRARVGPSYPYGNYYPRRNGIVNSILDIF